MCAFHVMYGAQSGGEYRFFCAQENLKRRAFDVFERAFFSCEEKTGLSRKAEIGEEVGAWMQRGCIVRKWQKTNNTKNKAHLRCASFLLKHSLHKYAKNGYYSLTTE